MDPLFDVVVIGAGLQGLAAAKTFLDLESALKLIILDSGTSIGGVWSKENIYPGLKSNNVIGTYEYTDFPMNEAFGVAYPEHIPGEVIHQYLYRYAEVHDLIKRVELRTKVVVAAKIQEGWKLELEVLSDHLKPVESSGQKISQPLRRQSMRCSKLVVATGLTSAARPIKMNGDNDFEAPIINFGQLALEALHLCKDESIQNVTVYGGGKSSHDIVYLMAKHGKCVNWVIRKSGHGPTYMAPSHIYVGPFKCWLEKLTTTRLITWFSPCVWGDADGFGCVRYLLHRTRLGRWLVDTFWNKLGSDLISQTKIASHKDTRKLIPDQAPFWYGVNLSILNYPTDIYDFVRNGQIIVIRKDVMRLDCQKTVRFDDGTSVQTDALICSSGWKFTPSMNFQPQEIQKDLGIPYTELSKTQVEIWEDLNTRADSEILERFPKFLEGPRTDEEADVSNEVNVPAMNLTEMKNSKERLSPWRLWRGIAPPSLPTKDLVFLGHVQLFQGALQSEISSIWAYAYMFDKLTKPVTSISEPSVPLSLGVQEGKVQRDEQEKILYDTALFNRYGKWRRPYGFGSRHPDLVFEGLPYFDLLLQDLGLRRWRKGWGWLGEVFGGSYGQADYVGLVQEWKTSQEGKEEV